MAKKRHIFIPVFLLALFVAYQASITMFSHVHYVNGVMIVHSHPSADNQHNHTEGQILTLAQVAEWMGMEPVFVTLPEVSFPICDAWECQWKSDLVSGTYRHSVSLRAPPTLFLS